MNDKTAGEISATRLDEVRSRLGYPNDLDYSVQPKNVGKKSDTDKLRYDLLSPWATEQVVKVLTAGAAKYGDRNWENGIHWTRIIAAIRRHLAAIEMGYETDPDSGLPHSAHLACEIHFLQHFEIFRKDFDDRVKRDVGLSITGVQVTTEKRQP